ncbi:MAG: hypothetical protein ACP5NX_00975, partial [Candidatus Bilamarchaeaceae archaeon]
RGTEPENSESIHTRTRNGIYAIITFQKDKVTINRDLHWTFEISAGKPGRFTCPAGVEHPLKAVRDDLEMVGLLIDQERFTDCARKYLGIAMSYEQFITAGGDLRGGERTILDSAHADYEAKRRKAAIIPKTDLPKDLGFDLDKITNDISKYGNGPGAGRQIMIPNSAPPTQNPYLPKQTKPGNGQVLTGKGKP